jgi:hypothetical protein
VRHATELIRTAGVALVALTLVASMSVGLTSASAASGTPTLAQIASGLTMAASASAPDFTSTVPTLANPTPLWATTNVYQCFRDGIFPKDPATECSFGDTASQQTVYVFGDSQAAMWMPAFDVLGQQLGLHVIYVAKAGCGPMYAFITSQGSACTAFEQAAIAYANQLKPTYVFPIGFEQSELGRLGDPRVVLGMSEVVRALAPSGAKVILLGSSPHLKTQGQFSTCPLVHPNDLVGCETTPSSRAVWRCGPWLKRPTQRS